VKQSPFEACFEAGGCIADAFGRVALGPPVGQDFVLHLRSELQSSPAHAGRRAALRRPTRIMMPAPCKPTAVVATSNTRFAIPSCRRIGSRNSGDDHLCLSLDESAAQAALYFHGSVDNQLAFDSGYSAASWSLQPHRHISSGIRPTEETSWLSSRLWRFKLDAWVRQIKSESGAMHNVPNLGRWHQPYAARGELEPRWLVRLGGRKPSPFIPAWAGLAWCVTWRPLERSIQDPDHR
jgi:hypothetical protein